MVFLRTLGLLVALRAYGCTQQACLHFAESLYISGLEGPGRLRP